MNRLFVFLLFYFYDSLLNGQIVDSIIIKEVDSLIVVSKEFTSSKNYLKAIEINSIAEKLVLEKLGQESAAFGKICLHYGVIMYSKRDYLEAEKWYLLAKDIQERVLGKHNSDYANTLNNLGILYWSKGDFIKSEPFFIEALAIRELVYGKYNSTIILGL
ncbi:MAG: tetratricopeptide repeat protein [Saprospiraceae bacterium]|nr:tetratricopeptide repeat protein [Candidatus Vicinibacter affinis]